jgi:CRISPR/Cas system-associated exonuclease Cas4 (RecB family)
MTEVAVTEALGESRSPSQANTYLTCPAKWYFHYLLGLSEPMALRRRPASATWKSQRRARSSRRNGRPPGAKSCFGTRRRMRISLRRPVKLWLQRMWQRPLLRLSRARRANGSRRDRRRQGAGIVDLVDVEGRVLDFKTASKRPKGISAEHGLQLTTYAMITPGASGLCRLDTVTKPCRMAEVGSPCPALHFAERLPAQRSSCLQEVAIVSLPSPCQHNGVTVE